MRPFCHRPGQPSARPNVFVWIRIVFNMRGIVTGPHSKGVHIFAPLTDDNRNFVGYKPIAENVARKFALKSASEFAVRFTFGNPVVLMILVGSRSCDDNAVWNSYWLIDPCLILLFIADSYARQRLGWPGWRVQKMSYITKEWCIFYSHNTMIIYRLWCTLVHDRYYHGNLQCREK